MQRDSFIFYKSWWDAVGLLPGEVRGEVLTAIIEYGLLGKEPVIDNRYVKAFFAIIKSQIDRQGKSGGTKGADSDENRLIRNSSSMKQWRKAVFERDEYKCRMCGKKGGKLNAHHIKPFSLYPDLRFDVNNGITLCRQCHIELHKSERAWEMK